MTGLLLERGLIDPATLNDRLFGTLCVALIPAGYLAFVLVIGRRCWKGTPIVHYIHLLFAVLAILNNVRFPLFGSRFAANLTLQDTRVLLKYLHPQYHLPCPADDPSECTLDYAKHRVNQSAAMPNQTNADPVLYLPLAVYFWENYVRFNSWAVVFHTVLVAVAGILFPLLVWTKVRDDNIARHRLLGRIALLAILAGMLVSIPYIILRLKPGSSLSEKAIGLGLARLMVGILYYGYKGWNAAKQGNNAEHELQMVRLVGFFWGVFPLERIIHSLPPLVWLPGRWNLAAGLPIGAPLGVKIAEWALLPRKTRKTVSFRKSA